MSNFLKKIFIVLSLIMLAVSFPHRAFSDTKTAGTASGDIETPLFRYESHGNRDPFMSLLQTPGLSDYAIKETPAGEEVTQLYVRLEGIVWDPTEPLALVNEKVVRENEVHDNMKILKIKPDHIVVLFKNKEFTFALESSNP